MLQPTQVIPGESDPILLEVVRMIYNQSRSYFTKDLPYRYAHEQWEWWSRLDHSKSKLFVWRDTERPYEIVAFSFLRDEDTYASPLFGIGAWARGRGYARAIIKHYIETAGKPLRCEQLVSHVAIRKLNRDAGWFVLREQDGVQSLYHPGPGTYPDYDAILKGLDG